MSDQSTPLYFVPTTVLQKSIFHRYFSTILSGGAKEIHLRTIYKRAFGRKPILAEHHLKTASKAQHETAIHDCVRRCSSNENMQRLLELFPEILFESRIKQTTFSYENPVLALYL